METRAAVRAAILAGILAGIVAFVPAIRAVADEQEDIERAGPYHNLEYRLIGPAAGGRACRVAGVPGDPRTCWVATAAGGVWKSTNGGDEWEPMFDTQPVSSVGSIAVAPSDPNVVWVGTGEANIRGNVAEGNGIYRSTDAGLNWSHVWKSEGQIGTMIVHPRDPDVAFAAVLGSPFGPGEDRGVYRTTDGGATWERVLHVDSATGAADVCFDPSNPRILFAGTWQTRRTPWSLTSGGPGGGLWTSRDGGDTWKRLEAHGLPEGIWGRVGVAVAAADPRRVYALIEAEEGGLFRSDDGGREWTRINASRGLRQRAWYYTTLTIDPHNADVVWFPQVGMLKTVDGGSTVRAATGGGWDYHDVWIDPADTDRILVASDAGVSLSRDGGETWQRPPLPISQFYHLSVDSRVPYRVLGSLQDRGTVSGPSDTLHRGGILLSDWHAVGGGEAGHVVADPSDPDVVWAGEYLGYISRWDGATRQEAHVGVYPDNGSGHGAADLRYRFQWTAPIVISPHDPETVYHAGNVLFRTRDRGQSWQAISADLSRNDAARQQWSGGPLTGDNTGVEFYGTIFAVAESPLERGVIWAGTDDGLVHLTRDDGASWSAVTPRDLPEWSTVAMIEASRWDAATAYVVADAHRLDDETPYLWKTIDSGRTWTRLGRDLDPETYLHVVREDTRRRDMLYLGTERGVLVSRDGGETWESLRLNLPTVAVVDLVVAGDDLVVGTLGRSAWILDDLTPVRDMTETISASPAHLFGPRPATRWHYASEWSRLGSDDGAGKNPARGAAFTYHLAKKPDAPITLEVLAADGRVVRSMSSELELQYTTEEHSDWDPETELEPALPSEPGLNRAAWDLAWDRPGWVPGARLDSGAPSPMPWALPGDYTLRLIVDEVPYTRPLRVEPDPRSTASPEDMAAQLDFVLDLRDCLNRITDLVATIRSVRGQIAAHAARLSGDPANADLVAMGQRLDETLGVIEERLHNPHAEVDYDVLAGRHGGARLASRLHWLAGGAHAHDGPPTQGMSEVYMELSHELNAQQAALDRVLAEDLAALNESARSLGVPFVSAVVGAAPLRVATDAVFPPFHYVDESGELAGFDIDLARTVIERAGRDATFTRAESYAALFAGLEAGDHDVVAATTGITPERQERYGFTRPYFVTCLAVLVRAGAGEPASPADLAGRAIAASGGTTSARAAHMIDGARVLETTRWRDSLAALRAGEVDAVIIDEFEAVPFARDADDLEVLAEPAALESYGLVLRRDEVDLRRRLDAAIAAMESDGSLAALRVRHGLDRPPDWPVRPPRPRDTPNEARR